MTIDVDDDGDDDDDNNGFWGAAGPVPSWFRPPQPLILRLHVATPQINFLFCLLRVR